MLKWINKKRNKKGFTLVELVVVIAILGILAAIAVPRLTGAKTNAEKNAHNSNVAMIENAITLALANDAETTKTYTSTKELVDAGYLSNEPKVPYDIKDDESGGAYNKGADYTFTIEEGASGEIASTHKITVIPEKQD